VRASVAVLLTAGALAPLCAAAAPPIVIDGRLGAFVAGRHLDALEDPTGALSIADMVSPDVAARFRPCESDQNSYGVTDSAYWFRFTIDHRAGGPETWYLEVAYALLDRVELYTPGPAGDFSVQAAGDSLPFAQRRIHHRTIVFPVTEPPGVRTFYLRVVTTSSLNLPLTLYSPGSFEEKSDIELLFLWMYYGLILGLAIYNLFLFVVIRDRSYIFYVLYIIGFGLFILTHNGLAFQYLWPNATSWASQAHIVFAGLGAALAVQFTRQFLDTRRRAPRTDRLFIGLMAIGVLMLVLSFFGLTALLIRLGAVVLIVMLVTILVNGVILFCEGFRPARWYLVAWSAFAVGMIVALLKAIGVLPIHFLTQWGYQIGSAFEVLLLSLALADRINLLQDELATLNIELESKVEDRTHSLTAANLQLAEINRRMERESRGREKAQAEASQLEVELRQAQKLEASGRLAGEVSRDMRQVLDEITLAAFKLQEEGEVGEPGRVAVEILAGAQRGRDLTGTLLRFAQDEELNKRRLSLNELVARVGASLRRSVPRGIAVVRRLEPDLAEVEGDADLLEQAVTGLCRNAIEAMGEEGTLTLVTENAVMSQSSLVPYPDLEPGMYVRLQVVDTGVGMGPQTLQQSLEPFFSTKRDAHGAGLGLPLVYGTVRQHGGFVALVSQPGVGTTATVCLPAAEDEPASE